jgi:hypothetical protein
VVWRDDDEIYSAIVDPDTGKRKGQVNIISEGVDVNPRGLSLMGTLNGKAYFACHCNFPGYGAGIYYTKLDQDGARAGSIHKVSRISYTCNYNTDIVIGGAGDFFNIGFVWGYYNQGSGVRFTGVSQLDGIKKFEMNITDADAGGCDYPSIVYAGFAYGVVWRDNRDNTDRIYFNIVRSTDHKRLLLDQNISGDDSISCIKPKIVWTWDNFGVVWEDWREGYGAIYYAAVNTNGNRINIGSFGQDYYDIRISKGGIGSWSPSLVYSGDCFAVAWNTNHGIRFARFTEKGLKKDIGCLTGNPTGKIEGYYYIRHRNTGKYLTHYKYNTGDGDPKVCLREYSGDESVLTQKWRFATSKSYPNRYKIISALPGTKRITMKTKMINGLECVSMFPYLTKTGGPKIMWRLQYHEKSNCYLIRNEYDSDFRLYVDDSNADEPSIRSYTGSNKLWQIFPADD